MHAALEPQGYDLLQQLEQAGALTPTGLTLTDPNMPIEQAEAVGLLLGRMSMSVKFAIGDWLLFIERVYPSEWTQLAEVLQMSEENRRDHMRVSERVPRSRRRARLDWSMHRAVAALPPAEQKHWLKQAEEQRMSHHALRAALRNGQPAAVQTTCRCCGRPLGG